MKIGTTYSGWLETKTGVPLGPLFFNICINDFMYINEQSEVCNFANDANIFSCGNSFEIFAPSIEDQCVSVKHIKWL